MQHWEKEQMPHAVYRLLDRTGAVLYIGCSQNPFGGRLYVHGSVQPWIKEVATVKVEWFPTWTDGRRAEAIAVRAENPRYNIDKSSPDVVGKEALRRAGRRRRGNGKLCPRCGNPKEDPRPGRAYCKSCYREYKKERAERLTLF